MPESIKFVFSGTLKPWVGGKDLILHTIGDIGVDGALYKAMEFSGEVIHELSMADRFSMTNMAIEAGAKNGIFPVDRRTIEYVEESSKSFRRKDQYTIYESDPDATYKNVREYNLKDLESQVAFPHLPENTKNISN